MRKSARRSRDEGLANRTHERSAAEGAEMNGLGLPYARAGDAIRPLEVAIPAFASAESARRRLDREALRFLVVVASGHGKLVGAVDRAALAPRPCCGRPVGPCPVVRHLAPDVAFCFDHEPADEVTANEAELAVEGVVPRARPIPMIVVDGEMRPLGIFSPPVAGTAAAEPPSSRAA